MKSLLFVKRDELEIDPFDSPLAVAHIDIDDPVADMGGRADFAHKRSLVAKRAGVNGMDASVKHIKGLVELYVNLLLPGVSDFLFILACARRLPSSLYTFRLTSRLRSGLSTWEFPEFDNIFYYGLLHRDTSN